MNISSPFMRFLAILSITIFTSFATDQPRPGSLAMFLNVPSVNNMVTLLATLMPQYAIDGKTFPVLYNVQGWGYELNIDSISFDKLVVNDKSIKFLPNSNTLRFAFSGINFSSKINGELKILWMYHLKFADFNLNDLSFQVDVAVQPQNDMTKWSIKQDSNFGFSNFLLQTNKGLVNMLMGASHKMILKKAQQYIPEVKDMVNDEISSINQKLLHGESFLVNVYDPAYPINLTPTQMPIVDNYTQMISAFFDGTFYDTFTKTNHVLPNSKYPILKSNFNSNQVFIHQSMLTSLFFVVDGMFMPYRVDDYEMASQLLTLFPEIKIHYGNDVKLQLEVSLSSETGNFLTLSKTQGIEIGKGEPATISLLVFCSNAKVTNEFCVHFDMNIETQISASVTDFYANIKIGEGKISGTKIIHDSIGMFDRDYDSFLSVIMETFVENFNNEWQKPYDLANLDPTVGMIRFMLKDLRFTPFVEDEFFYFGFTYFLDKSNLQEQTEIESETTKFVVENQAHFENMVSMITERSQDALAYFL